MCQIMLPQNIFKGKSVGNVLKIDFFKKKDTSESFLQIKQTKNKPRYRGAECHN